MEFLYRNLVDRAMPGSKITLVGIYCIKRNVSMGKVNQFLRKTFFFNSDFCSMIR